MKSADKKRNLRTFFQRSRNHLLQENTMKNILFVLSSPRGWKSYSHQFASHIVDDLKARHPGAKVVVRDVAKEPLPHVDEAFVTGRVLPAEKRSPAEAKALALSDALVDELAAADVVVLAVPMYNFALSSDSSASRTYTWCASKAWRWAKRPSRTRWRPPRRNRKKWCASSRDPGLKRRSVMSTLLRNFLKGGLYLAAILLLPGALIGAPILWWLGHRRKTPRQPTWKACSLHNVVSSPG